MPLMTSSLHDGVPTMPALTRLNLRALASKRELAAAVRAFVDFMKETNPPGLHWQNTTMSEKD